MKHMAEFVEKRSYLAVGHERWFIFCWFWKIANQACRWNFVTLRCHFSIEDSKTCRMSEFVFARKEIQVEASFDLAFLDDLKHAHVFVPDRRPLDPGELEAAACEDPAVGRVHGVVHGVDHPGKSIP